MGFARWEVVEAKGKSIGLLWLWKEEVELEVKWKNGNVMRYLVKDFNEQGCWQLFGTYGPTNYSDKRKF